MPQPADIPDYRRETPGTQMTIHKKERLCNHGWEAGGLGRSFLEMCNFWDIISTQVIFQDLLTLEINVHCSKRITF